jgi:ribonuclease VapC
MMIDASAFVAMLTDEPEGPVLSECLSTARNPLTTPIALFESALGIARKRSIAPSDARAVLDELVELVGVTEVPITPKIGKQALEAFAAYGKGTGHPAQLNLGDCFAYAAARVHHVPLLFKGEDFKNTDIPRA